MIGQTLGHYKIVEKLGAGGMGEVYRAEDTTLKRQVALKVLPAELSGSQERLERFQREAESLAALDHPNIVHIYSVEEVEGVRFLTMQLVDGKPLSELIPANGMALEQIFKLATPMADGLRAAHEKGIIHRDLKPENVMVDEEGRVKVLDFGLAKLRFPELAPGDSELPTQAMTQEGLVLGTMPYMSPEQVQGRPVDHRTDLFSFGILLYEMLCGRRPFQGENTASLVSSIMRDQPEPVADLKPGLPARLVEIMERCLEKDPAERYQSTEVLRDDLQEVQREVVSGQAVMSQPTARVGQLRSRALRLGLLTVLIVVTILIGIYAWRDHQDQPPAAEGTQITSLAVLPLHNLSGDPEQDYFVDGMTEALITDLSKIGALKVISRSSAMRFKGSDQPISEIAAALGVDAVVEGSVIREGDRVGITAQLIEASTDENIWADRYERDLTSILSLQGEIAQAIAVEIQVALTPEEENLLASTRAVDPAAHEAYLKGMFHLQKFTPQDFELALQYFESAIEIDPGYAPAHSGVASAWIYINQLGVVAPSEAIPQVQPALAKALELDPLLADAHMVQAFVAQVWDWDWEGADAAFQRAIELNPNYADAHIFYSHFATQMGRPEEGTAAAQRALELDPLNPFYQGLYGIQMSLTGQLEEGITQIRRGHEMAPGFNFGRQALAYILGYAGRREEALAELRTHYVIVDDRQVLDAMDKGESEAGYESAMKAVADTLSERSQTSWVHAFDVFTLYDLAGERDLALEWLEKAYEGRDPDMPYLGVLWLSEELRAEPGFRDLLRRMEFPAVISESGGTS